MLHPAHTPVTSQMQRRQTWHAIFPALHRWPQLPQRATQRAQCQTCGVYRITEHVEDCVFCDPEQIKSLIEWRTSASGRPVMVFEPLNPVVPGHRLVVPSVHVTDACEDPALTGEVMRVAAEAAATVPAANLITSTGEPGTRSVTHLHVHIVPRESGDGAFR